MTLEEYRRRVAGAQNRASGAAFEGLVERACAELEKRHLAKITKTPEPMRPISRPDKSGAFRAVFTKQAQPDFSGTMRGGRAIRFEAKHTTGDRIEQKRVTDAQLDDLVSHENLGALCFVLVQFGSGRVCKIPLAEWIEMKQRHGRLYITEEEAEIYTVSAADDLLKFDTRKGADE